MQMLGRREGMGGPGAEDDGFGAGGGNYAPRAAAPAPSRNAPSAPAPADGGFADIDDDIPF